MANASLPPSPPHTVPSPPPNSAAPIRSSPRCPPGSLLPARPPHNSDSSDRQIQSDCLPPFTFLLSAFSVMLFHGRCPFWFALRVRIHLGAYRIPLRRRPSHPISD